MPDIKDTLLNKLLTDWLDNWKNGMPDRWVDKLGENVPRDWLDKFRNTEPNWLEVLLETTNAVNDLCHFDNRDIWDALNNYLECKYKQRTKGIQGQHTWKPPGKNPVRAQAINDPISWKDFLSQAIDILLEKIPRYSENSMYFKMVLHIEFILKDSVANAYKAELHGRKQQQNWKDLRDLAIELLLEGKRHWNRSSIEERVKKNAATFGRYWPPKGPTKQQINNLENDTAKIVAIAIEDAINSLVSAAYEHENKVKQLYAEYANKTGLSIPEELETIEITQNLHSFFNLLDHLKKVSDDQELVQFATNLLENDEELIVVKHPYNHRITVVFKSNEEIALRLGYTVEKVCELKGKLEKALERFQIDVEVSL